MTVVETREGRVRGRLMPTHETFAGIPFAAPLGPGDRFRPPRPATTWTGERDAFTFAASCLQGSHRVQGMAASGPTAEDCLFLNVYTPAADNGRRPVMVWIHGGGFAYGSGSELLYDGGALACVGDVVVVTIHYRLGVLGFGCLGDASRAWGATANAGLLDQVEALQWVQRNIPAFGGDPQNVTIFGESAGSVAVACLLAMPAAKGLFTKAIMQSGVGDPGTFADASPCGVAAIGELGIDPADCDGVENADLPALIEAATLVAPALGGFGPVIDDKTLPMSPVEANASGYSADVPLLLGTNRDEMRLFNVYKTRPEMTEQSLRDAVRRMLNADDAAARDVIEAFRQSRSGYGLPTGSDHIHDGIQSVLRMRLPTARFAAHHASHQPATWHYLFDWESPAMRGALGACHALEMPFVFGTLDAPTQDRFAGSGPEATRLSAQMLGAWATFARTGSPVVEGADAWPAFDDAARQTMILGRSCHVTNDPFVLERQAVEAWV